MTNKLPIALCLIVIGMTVISCSGPPVDDAEMIALALPAGDPEAGRLAFVELSCTSCHFVHADADAPLPVSASPGPVIGPALARKSRGELATAIVAPSHEISFDVRQRLPGQLSQMADYGDAITVRQLIDLVAYLRSMDQPKPDALE